MIIDCPTCGSSYNVADDKVRGRRVRIRCRGCASGIVVDGRDLDPADVTRKLSPDDLTRQYRPSFSEDEATRVMTAPPRRGELKKVEPKREEPRRLEPSTPAVDEWLVSAPGAPQRAMTVDAIVEAFNAGLIDEDVLLWREGMKEWARLGDVEEVATVIDTESTTHVFTASSLRMTTRKAPSRPAQSKAPAKKEPSPAAAPAPPADTEDRVSSSQPVHARPPPPSAPPRRAAARVVGARASGGDLFRNVDRAGSERELLGRDSQPPSVGETSSKPTGARSESSLLFSMNAVKAGATSSAPPPAARAAPPPSAAEILGMPSSPANQTLGTVTPMNPQGFATMPERDPSPLPTASTNELIAHMDTTPPAAPRSSARALLKVASAALVIGALLGAGWFVLRRSTGTRPALEPVERAATTDPARVEPLPIPEPETTPAASTAGEKETTQVESERTPPAATERSEKTTAPVRRAPAPSRLKAPALPPAVSKAATPDETPSEATAPTTSKKMKLDEDGIPVVDLTEDDGNEEAAPPSAPSESKSVEPKAAAESETEGESNPPFDANAAKAALTSAAMRVFTCKEPEGPVGAGKVQVTFAPSGRPTAAVVIEGSFVGTSVGGCVARVFKNTSIPPFEGEPVTVSKGFSIPE